MNFQIRLVIFKKKYVHDDIIVTAENVCKYEKNDVNKQVLIQEDGTCDNYGQKKFCPVLLNKKGLNANLVSAYVYTMVHSSIYRKSAIRVLEEFIKSKINLEKPVILIRLRTPKYQFLDYRW